MISHWFFEIYHHFPGRSTISFRSIKQNVGQLHARLAKTRPTKTPGACGNSEPKPKSLKRWASSIDGSFNKTRMSRVETGDFLRISGEKNIEQVIRVAFCSLGEDKKLGFFCDDMLWIYWYFHLELWRVCDITSNIYATFCIATKQLNWNSVAPETDHLRL